jgi:hypothetical protein
MRKYGSVRALKEMFKKIWFGSFKGRGYLGGI